MKINRPTLNISFSGKVNVCKDIKNRRRINEEEF